MQLQKLTAKEIVIAYGERIRNFTATDLRGAHLVDAHLVDAKLVDANLVGATVNWQSRELIIEILRQHATFNWQFMAIGFICIRPELCWSGFDAALPRDMRDWVYGILAQYVKDGDSAPDLLAAYIAANKPKPDAA